MNILLIILAVVLLVCIAWLVLHNANTTHSAQPRRHKGLRRHWRKVYLMPIGLHRLLGWMPGARLQTEIQFANIGEGTFGTGVKTYVADADTTARYLLYKKGSDVDHVAICAAGNDPLGSSDDQAVAGEPIAINLFGAVRGTVRVVTDGTVADGEYVKAGANGKVTQASTTDLSFGRAIIGTDASSADGDVITIIPMVPAKYVF